VSLSQQRGTVSSTDGTVQLPQLAPWEYLWLYALPTGAGAAAWWTGSPAQAADGQLGAGQWRLFDTGTVANRTLYLSGDLEWITDTDPIQEQVSTAGPMTVETAAGAPLDAVFPTAQQITFDGAQQVVLEGTADITGPVSIQGGPYSTLALETAEPRLPPDAIYLGRGWPGADLAVTLPATCLPASVMVIGYNHDTVAALNIKLGNNDASLYGLFDAVTIPAVSSSLSAQRGTLIGHDITEGGVTFLEVAIQSAAVGVPAEAFSQFYVAYLIGYTPTLTSFDRLAANTTLVAAPGAPGILYFLGADVSLEPSTGAVPAYGVVTLQGATSGRQLWRFTPNWQTNVGVMTISRAIRPNRPVRLPENEGIEFTTAASGGGAPQATGVVYTAVGA
jgi:hypothetical protein